MTIQTTYPGRLPYAWGWDREGRTEYLLDRSYRAIARRQADYPWQPVALPGTDFPDIHWKGWFYEEPCYPGHDEETRHKCEHVYVDFMLGYDVQGWLLTPEHSDVPDTQGRYMDYTCVSEALEEEMDGRPLPVTDERVRRLRHG